MKNKRTEINQVINPSCIKKCNKGKRKITTFEDLCTKTVSVADNLPVRCVGQWAFEKIYYLNQYFGIFSTGMKKSWEGNINYIEICSGPGRCINRENGFEFNGTPLCIIENPARKYLKMALFFDYNEKVINTLNQRIESQNITNAKALFGDYNNAKDICNKIVEETGGYGLNLVFIDPTDCSVPFQLLTELSKNLKHIDFIVNLATGTDFNRNIRNAILYPEFENVLNKYTAFLGSSDLFSDPRAVEYAKNGNHKELRNMFREYYQLSLKKLGFQYFDFKQIRSFYDLIFATSHSKGLEFWQKANETEYDGQRQLF